MAEFNEASARALMADSAPVFEELADTFEASARALRAINILSSANAPLESMIPHMNTGILVFREFPRLSARLDALLTKVRGLRGA